MNTENHISDDDLQRWIDGEAGPDRSRIESYLETEPDAMARVDALRRPGEWLREMVDGGLGPVDTLEGVAAIRERVREREESRWQVRWREWWGDIWAFNRGAVLGVALAAVSGVIAAPALLWLMAEEAAEIDAQDALASDENGDGLYLPAGIAIERLEVEDGTARVLGSGETTLIWVDANGSDNWEGQNADVVEEKP